MTRTYLVVFEKVAEDNWGAFTPDIGGAVGAGGSLGSARQSVLAGIGFQLEYLANHGQAAPEATTGSFDFAEFDPDHTNLQNVVEWLSIQLPESETSPQEKTQQAA